MQVNLFGSKFTKLLEKRDETLAANISKYDEWFKELKSIRDPAAHRIPITFASGTIIGKNVEKYQAKMKRSRDILTELTKEKPEEISELIKYYKKNENLLDESMKLHSEAQDLEEFQPIVIRYDDSQVEYRAVVPLVFDDHKNFLEIGNIIADFYLSRTE